MPINIDMFMLGKIIRKKETFKMKLPDSARLYSPAYDVHMYLEEDIVIFEAANVNTGYFFIGKIKRTGVNRFGHRWYDVVCILRPGNRHTAYKTNWLPKARITRGAILCELTPERM